MVEKLIGRVKGWYNMKKVFWVILLLIFVMGFVACTNEPSDVETVGESIAPADSVNDASTEVSTETTTEVGTELNTESTTESTTESSTEHTVIEYAEPTFLVTDEDLYKIYTQGQENVNWKENTAIQGDGFVTFQSVGTDPWITPILDGKTIDGETPNATSVLAIKYRTYYSVQGQVKTPRGGISRDKKFYWTGDGQWHLLVLELDASTFSKLQLDYANTADVSIDIQYMAFFNRAEEALGYDNTIESPVARTGVEKLPDFKVSSAFGSHMVVQRDMPIKVWGFSNAVGSTITGSFADEVVKTQVAADGTWTLTFSPKVYQTTGQAMIISDDRNNRTVFEDVLIGDVWVVSGQSNAALGVASCFDYLALLGLEFKPNFVASANDPIRLFDQSGGYASSQAQKTATLSPQLDVINPDWGWARADGQAVMNFSAIGYFFAKEVIKKTDVPQGIIAMSAGGATLSELFPAWVAHEQGYTGGSAVCEGGYYNTLMHPFMGLSFKGMLFFQGESEAIGLSTAQTYGDQFAALIADQRERFGHDFSLYYVQLCNYLGAEDGRPSSFKYQDVVRMKQFDALSKIPNAKMVVSMDLGSPMELFDHAHSPYKYELGRRLAYAALAKEYQVLDESEVTSPMPTKATLSEDKTKIIVEFKNVADGLIVHGMTPEESIGKTVAGFSIGDFPNCKLVTATITSANTVEITVPSGTIPTQVNYAYFTDITPEMITLYAGNGFPAVAFAMPLD